MLCRLPEDVAGVLVESDDASVVGAADVEEDGVSLDERGADHAMPFFGHGEFVTGIDVPEKFRAVFWPCRRDVLAAVDAVTRGAEELRPVFCAERIYQRTKDESKRSQSCSRGHERNTGMHPVKAITGL